MLMRSGVLDQKGFFCEPSSPQWLTPFLTVARLSRVDGTSRSQPPFYQPVASIRCEPPRLGKKYSCARESWIRKVFLCDPSCPQWLTPFLTVARLSRVDGTSRSQPPFYQPVASIRARKPPPQKS